MMSGGKLCCQTRPAHHNTPGPEGAQLDLERGGRDSEERRIKFKKRRKEFAVNL